MGVRGPTNPRFHAPSGTQPLPPPAPQLRPPELRKYNTLLLGPPAGRGLSKASTARKASAWGVPAAPVRLALENILAL